jgi:hypothetical protein
VPPRPLLASDLAVTPDASAVLLVVLWAQAGNVSVTVDRATYLSDLERAITIVAAAATPQQALGATSDLPSRWLVPVDGHTISVEAGWIRTELGAANAETWSGIRHRITRRLATMRAEAAEPTIEHVRDPKAVLTETLARQEFRGQSSPLWLEQQLERFGRWMRGVMSRVFGPSSAAGPVAVMTAWIVAALAFVALSLWLVSLSTRRPRTTALALGSTAPRPAAAREWALRAGEAARRGDMREAVRCGYRAALLRLEEQGIWRIDESRTPREYIHILTRQDPRYGTFSDLTGQFEQVFYGHRPATTDDARQVAVHLEHLGCLPPADRAI